jgi:hypothetical protein
MGKAQKNPDKTKLQQEAERQALAMQRELLMYRQLAYPAFSRPMPTLETSPYWRVSHETLNGDFDLDGPLAGELASRVVSSHPEAGWLRQYLDGKLFDPSANLYENIGDVTIGPGNILDNANAVRQAYEAAKSQSKINSAAARIAAGKAQSVKINSHMTLYNANNSGKGPPRLRVKITGQPVKVISPKFSTNDIKTRPFRGGFSARAGDVKSLVDLESMSSKMRFFNGKIGGGVLTFAPTAAFDLYDSVGRDAYGNLHWDSRQFVNAELRNQSGNAVGWAAGALATIALGAAGVAGAPLIVCVLIVGIAAQFVWNAYGAPSKMPQLNN